MHDAFAQLAFVALLRAAVAQFHNKLKTPRVTIQNRIAFFRSAARGFSKQPGSDTIKQRVVPFRSEPAVVLLLSSAHKGDRNVKVVR